MNILTTALLLAGVITLCSATTCYVCDSTDAVCDDEYAGSADHEIDCNSVDYVEDGGCSKAKSKYKLLGVWINTVSRSCAKTYDNSVCAQKNRVKVSVIGINTETWACSCDGDKCNGGSQLAFSSALIIAALAKYLL